MSRRNADNVNYRNNDIFGTSSQPAQAQEQQAPRNNVNYKDNNIFGGAEASSPAQQPGRRIRPNKDSDIFGSGGSEAPEQEHHGKHVNKDNVNYKNNNIFGNGEAGQWETSNGAFGNKRK